MRGLLLINPRAGTEEPTTDNLGTAARARGIDVHVLQEGEDTAELARAAETEVLGAAGGDGSVASVATVAVERGLPFVVVPYGTRNHFARDLGLDRTDPLAALDAFDGHERRVDVGRAGERLFLNNVSLGAYAALVHRREHHRRRRQALAGLRALWIGLRERAEVWATLNLYWTARVESGEARAADDVDDLGWFEPDELPSPDELAFQNVPLVLAAWRARLQHA